MRFQRLHQRRGSPVRLVRRDRGDNEPIDVVVVLVSAPDKRGKWSWVRAVASVEFEPSWRLDSLQHGDYAGLSRLRLASSG
jgi:hypothetical protein